MADANAQVRQGKTHKQPSHDVEVVACMARDSHREVSPRPSTSTVGDRRYGKPEQKPKRGIRKDMDAYGADYSRDPWQIIRTLGEEREKAQKAAILAKHGKGQRSKPMQTDKIGLAAYLLTQGAGFPEVVPGRKPGWVCFRFEDPDGELEYQALEYECGAEDDSRDVQRLPVAVCAEGSCTTPVTNSRKPAKLLCSC